MRWQPPPFIVLAQRDLIQVEVLELGAELLSFFVDVGLILFDGVLLLLAYAKAEVAEQKANDKCSNAHHEHVGVVLVLHVELGLLAGKQLAESDDH